MSTSVPSPEAQHRLATTSVADVMHRDVVSCARDADAADIARKMTSHRVHCIAVVEPAEDGSRAQRVWGIVSDLDLLSAAGGARSDARAGDLAREPVVAVRPTTSLRDAAQAMVRAGVHHVIVTDPSSHLPVGILSTLDVVGRLV